MRRRELSRARPTTARPGRRIYSRAGRALAGDALRVPHRRDQLPCECVGPVHRGCHGTAQGRVLLPCSSAGRRRLPPRTSRPYSSVGSRSRILAAKGGRRREWGMKHRRLGWGKGAPTASSGGGRSARGGSADGQGKEQEPHGHFSAWCERESGRDADAVGK